MPKTVFGNGTEVSPNWFNSQQNLVFDDLDLDGHHPRITDASLSNLPGNVKADWALFRNAFSVTAGVGLSVNIIGGTFTNSQDLPVTVASAGGAVPASTTSFLWITDAGTIAIGPLMPAISFPIASVITSPSAVTLITDLRPRFKFGPQSRSIAVFGGRSGTDLVYASNVSIDGVINCRNFTLNAGVTLTVPSGFLKIVASGTVTINGVINVTPTIAGGSSFSGEIFGPDKVQSDSGKGFGGGSGHNGPGGKAYPYEASVFGSGGASGLVSTTLSGRVLMTSSRGGDGGGALVVECAGVATVAGSINCNGGNASSGSFSGLTSGNVWITGGGAGSGGSIALRSLTQVICTAASMLSVRGGDGANAALSDNTALAVGGGGGGGGRIFLASPNTNITGSVLVMSGGVAGSNAGLAANGVNGSPGGGFGGFGGAAGFPGSIGQLTLQSFITV